MNGESVNGTQADYKAFEDIYRAKMFRRVIALTPDMHIGSRFALAGENWISKEGDDLSAMRNQGQKDIYDFWLYFLKICRKWNVDTLIAPGDLVNGYNRFEHGLKQMTTDLNEQADHVVQLLKPFKKLCGHRIYTLSGSGYHESQDTRIHQTIAEKLGGKFLGMISNMKLKGTNRVLNISHGVSAAWIYQTMIMSREALFMLAAAQQGKLEVMPDVIIRAHWHTWVHIHLEKVHLIQVPGWQAYVPWKGALMSYGKFQPAIGGAILFVDKSNRIIVHHYTMKKIPHITDKVWEG